MEHHGRRYNYEPLNDEPGQIRTLTLQGISNGIIECTIQQIKVSEGGYKALSYVWGSGEQPFHATVLDVNGERLGRIPLTTNLNDALRDLWNTEELAIKVFWIDQICIDQKGTEKNSQVALMGQIYQNASMVITYLGPVKDEEEEKEGLELLNRLDSHFSPNYERLSQMNDLRMAMQKVEELPVTKLPDDLAGDAVSKERWHWLAALCFGEWATRLWIVQEQLLNTQNIMLHGHRLLSWEATAVMPVLFMMDLLPQKHLLGFWNTCRWCEYHPGMITSSIFSIWINYSSNRQKQRSGAITSVHELLSNMGKFETLKCQDARDRIFALRAISSDSIRLGITPDYSKSREKVLLEASIAIIESHADLHFLTFACRMDNLFDLTQPSWAIAVPRPALLRSNALPYGQFCPHPCFDLRPRPRIDCHGSNSVLTLKGRIVDYISFTSSPMFQTKSFFLDIRDEKYTETCLQIAGTLSDALCHLGVTLENAAALCQALILKPIWKPTQGRGSPAKRTAYHFWCYFRHVVSLVKQYSQHLGLDVYGSVQFDHLIRALAPLVLEDDLNAFEPKDSLSSTEVDVAMHVWNYTGWQGRSVCTTKQRRVASCMNRTEGEDVLAVFRGADRLYVLRPTEGGRYRLVGDTYVDGLMLGESYEGFDADEVDDDIELI